MQMGFGLAIAILLIVGVVSYRSLLASRESEQWVRHTHEVLEHLESLLSAVQDVETSDRTFVLTDDKRFLEPYRSGVLRVAQEQETIRTLTADNPNQGRRLATLKGLTDQKIQFGDSLIRLRQTKGIEAADADIQRSYLLHANCYITKPVDLDGFLHVVKSIDNFWLSVVKLPPREARS